MRPDCPPAEQGRPSTLPPELYLSHQAGVEGGPVITPGNASRVVTAFWPLEETALAKDDRTTTDLIEAGPAAEYEDAISCQDLILGIRSLRIVRPFHLLNVYVPRQMSYPVRFLAEVETTVYGAHVSNAPPPGTPYVEYLVFVRTDANQPWKVAIETGYAGWPGSDIITPEDPAVAKEQEQKVAAGIHLEAFEAPPPRPGWIDPLAVPSLLANYWQHWTETGAPPPDDHFQVGGRWTTKQGAYLYHGKQVDRNRGVLHAVHYSVDLQRDGAYEFAVDNGFDLVCFAVRYQDRLNGPSGRRLHQDAKRNNFGALLPPGAYSSIGIRGLHQSCALVPPSPAEPLPAVGQTGIGVVGGDGGDTWLQGTA